MRITLPSLLPLSAAIALLFCASAVAALEIRLAYVGNTDGSAWLGVLQGQHEANIQGRFLDQTYTVDAMTPEGLAQSDPKPAAIIAAGDAAALQRLSEAVPGIVVFNVTADDDALRQACATNLLHVPPSSTMKADAVAQWLQKNPDASVEAWAWHPKFVKYAARDLNKRFLKVQGVTMDDDAWAGWAAVRMVAEGVIRTQSTDPSALLAFMKSEIAFDGQKGVPHTFRDTGQLRQRLLIVENGKLAGEAPVRGVADTTNLDSLGLPSCQP
jgi:ABC-type branched-subunit amino acid transport system substrate-binding protein